MRKASSQTGRAPREYRCEHCDSEIDDSGRILFVEEEVGRTFCSEDCIVSFFAPDIQRLEKHYVRHLKQSDLSAEDRERLAHLRWTTLEKPDEVWAEKTVAGDNRYTLIRRFKEKGQQVWCICVSLLLRGEPSFLYLAFVTRDDAMVDAFRAGEKLSWKKGLDKSGEQAGRREKPELRIVRAEQETGGETRSAEAEGNEMMNSSDSDGRQEIQEASEQERPMLDCLAEPFTADELIRAELYTARGKSDIPRDEFGEYEKCLDPTLEKPDEVWSMELNRKGRRLFNFLRRFPGGVSENPSKRDIWYIMIAKETTDPEQIEILDAFPTNDPKLAENYRKGSRDYASNEASINAPEDVDGADPGELAGSDEEPAKKVVH